MPAPELEEDSVDLTPMIDVVFLPSHFLHGNHAHR